MTRRASIKIGSCVDSGLGTPSIPKHVAIIMDGNGRWAEERGLPRSEGHRAGTENIRRVLRRCVDHNVDYLTLFTFSTENWNRPESEIKSIMSLLYESIKQQAPRLHKEGVRINHLGRLDRLSRELESAIRYSVDLTRDNNVINLNVAFDYGGRSEIIDAVRDIVQSGIPPEDVTEEVFKRYLYTNDIPDPDLIIRTAGEMRLSNFLLWQSAYAEYYSTPVLWPDFDEEEITAAIDAFGRRQRRYGGIVPVTHHEANHDDIV